MTSHQASNDGTSRGSTKDQVVPNHVVDWDAYLVYSRAVQDAHEAISPFVFSAEDSADCSPQDLVNLTVITRRYSELLHSLINNANVFAASCISHVLDSSESRQGEILNVISFVEDLLFIRARIDLNDCRYADFLTAIESLFRIAGVLCMEASHEGLYFAGGFARRRVHRLVRELSSVKARFLAPLELQRLMTIIESLNQREGYSRAMLGSYISKIASWLTECPVLRFGSGPLISWLSSPIAVEVCNAPHGWYGIGEYQLAQQALRAEQLCATLPETCLRLDVAETMSCLDKITSHFHTRSEASLSALCSEACELVLGPSPWPARLRFSSTALDLVPEEPGIVALLERMANPLGKLLLYDFAASIDFIISRYLMWPWRIRLHNEVTKVRIASAQFAIEFSRRAISVKDLLRSSYLKERPCDPLTGEWLEFDNARPELLGPTRSRLIKFLPQLHEAEQLSWLI